MLAILSDSSGLTTGTMYHAHSETDVPAICVWIVKDLVPPAKATMI
jgi:hypothetical protein